MWVSFINFRYIQGDLKSKIDFQKVFELTKQKKKQEIAFFHLKLLFLYLKQSEEVIIVKNVVFQIKEEKHKLGRTRKDN